MKPRKSLGQNFLHDIHTIGKIREALDLQPSDQLLEIGPGLGALTKHLLPNCRQYTAIEIDPRCVKELVPWEQEYPYFQIIEGDFLSILLEPWKNYTKVVGNLPYHIATPIMERVATQLQPNKIVCMFAIGTANRYIADVGTPHYSSASVMMQSFFSIETVCTVQKGSFFPPPSISSKVLSFIPKQVPVEKTLQFTKFVQKIFSYRRKTLYNAIKNSYSENVASHIQSSCTISMQRRPETCSIEEFHFLYQKYQGIHDEETE
ncbi:MAG: 16S rRNA (adenine(1518)-N(6)/adenine(1519)-N(6))-dimethyltransferase RsmA [Caldisericia bacterium]|nr:16S rRNA (adenine(1518)-N(6)/adenine(1519)-N(6))-dimethyltransferase RsmA [Caldisericia bacterium]MDD4614148.1 16S rRNA (adenine(1518)-N(6)/adenine(1519)-N(6))-dimethyltransferase RsmA [Caldisericia bacterium]